MRTPTPDDSPAQTSRPDEPVEPRTATVLAAVPAAATIVGPTLVALTHGWDYRFAVLLGTWTALGLLALAWRTIPAADLRGRTSLEFAGGFTAVLVCVYAADWFDWRPFGLDDALAGLAIGLVFVLAGPVRRALRLTERAPDDATFALQVLVLAPAGLPLVALLFGQGEWDGPAFTAVQFTGFGAALALAGIGMAFALRRSLFEAVFPLSMLAGLAAFALLDASGVSANPAALAGALACCAMFLAGLRAWRRAYGEEARVPARGVLPWLALASAATLDVDPVPIAGLTAGLVAAWWCLQRRSDLPFIAPSAPKRIDVRRSLLSGALAASVALLWFMHGLLLTAAAGNATGPMLLAAISTVSPYRVSDLTFSEALFADQYLWRDEPAPARLVAAASPERLVRVMRTDRDRWSGVAFAAALRARESRSLSGAGLEPGQLVGTGVQVAYVYPGSPAERAGVRRGDILRATDDDPASALRFAYVGGLVRLERPASGQPAREVALPVGPYSEPAVSDERILEAGGRRVGYLVLHDFDVSAGKAFLDAAERLRRAGIDELVLDLRMNPGGRVDVARDIASAIGGRRLHGRAFQRIEHNARYRDRDRDVPFRAPERGVLSLPRLFVITSGESCSASEALVNGLAPHMTVVTVGTATCGKPVGMTVVEYGGRAYWVITFRVLNARGEGDYYDGVRPTCRVDDDFGHDLGDPAEVSLSAALHYMRYGRCPQTPAGASVVL